MKRFHGESPCRVLHVKQSSCKENGGVELDHNVFVHEHVPLFLRESERERHERECDAVVQQDDVCFRHAGGHDEHPDEVQYEVRREYESERLTLHQRSLEVSRQCDEREPRQDQQVEGVVLQRALPAPVF